MLFTQSRPFCILVVYLPLDRDSLILFVCQVSEQRDEFRTRVDVSPSALTCSSFASRDVSLLHSGWNET